MRKITLALLLSLVVLVGFASAQTQIPKEGTSSGIVAFSNTFKALPMGQERVQITYEVFGVVITDSPDAIMHKASQHCLGAMHVIKGAYDDDGGFCVNTRPDGDKIFLTYKASGKMGQNAKGTFTYVGGTGKFVGIQGGGEIERITGVRPAADGTVQGYNISKGHYKLP